MAGILIIIQLIFLFAEYCITSDFNLIITMIVVINTALASFRSKSKILNTIIVIIFLIHLFCFGFVLYAKYFKSGSVVGKCSAAYNCDCRPNEDLCTCDYLEDDNNPNSKIKVSCPNQDY